MRADTPLTNAASKYGGYVTKDHPVVDVEFARNLERTLATKELAETKLRGALEHAYGALENTNPCADPACNQEQREWLDIAVRLAKEALFTPITTDALDSYVAEKVKEARGGQEPVAWEWREQRRGYAARCWGPSDPGYASAFPLYKHPYSPLSSQPTEQPK
mgnify:FL=1